MAVIDIPALMEMSRQDEMMRIRKAEAQRNAALSQESDAEFSFEKNGLKVKGKLKDLPKLSQDPNIGPYIQGVGQSLSEEQSVEAEERAGRIAEIQSKIAEIRNKRFRQEIEMGQGDMRTGFFNIQSRAGIVEDLKSQEKKLREMEAELSLNRQTGKMDQGASVMTTEQAAPISEAEQPTVVAPVTKPEEIPSFNSAAQARAAGIQPGQTVIIKGQRGSFRLKPQPNR